MKIDTQPLENHQLKVTVEATAEEYDSSRQKAIRDLTKKVKIPGFRPGKVPTAVALNYLDPKLVTEETLESFVDAYYPKILEEIKIDPYGPGTLEKVTSFEPLIMEFVIPLAPKVELGDYHSIREPYHIEPLEETEVKENLDYLQESYAMLEPVEDRPAQINDIVYIDISGIAPGKEDHPDEKIANFANYPIEILNENKQNSYEWPFLGFSKNLIGKNIGDQLEISYTYPDDYASENLKGKKANFSVTIKSIKQRNLPELNDEFAQSLGDFNNIEELKQSIHNSLEKGKIQEYNEDYDDQVLDKIIQISTIQYPPQMVEKEKELVIDQLEKRLKQSNMDLELYLKTRSMSREDFDVDAHRVAEDRIKRTLVLFEIAKTENVQVDPNQVQNEAAEAYNELTNRLQKTKLDKTSEQNIISNLFENVSMDILIRNTLEKVRQIAKGEEELTPSQPEQTQAEPAAVEPGTPVTDSEIPQTETNNS